jgi:hypothetical protein
VHLGFCGRNRDGIRQAQVDVRLGDPHIQLHSVPLGLGLELKRARQRTSADRMGEGAGAFAALIDAPEEVHDEGLQWIHSQDMVSLMGSGELDGSGEEPGERARKISWH